MSENCNISNVLQAFVKGRIEAIAAMVDHSYYLELFHNFVKLNWNNNYLAFFMVCIATGGRFFKLCHRISQYHLDFCMCF